MVSPPKRRPGLPPAGLVGAVAAGGAVGGSIRTWLYLAFPPPAAGFPWVTLVENVTGAMLMGVVATVLLERGQASPRTRALLTTGMLGSYTTFAGLAVEVRLLAGGSALAAGYLVATLGLGLGAAAGGIALARSLPRVRRREQP